jgi:hypothetical protein
VSAQLTITAALEALEAGDVRHAEAILLGALEDGPTERGGKCPECGLGFEWPGQLDEHVGRVHGYPNDGAPA